MTSENIKSNLAGAEAERVAGAKDAEHVCVKRINAMLAERKSNTVIATAINFSSPAREMIQIATAKDDARLRGKPVSFYASYCPFCGVKMHKDEA